MGKKAGFYDDLSMSDYHADDALSRSDILQLKKNPMKFRVQRQLIRKDTDAFSIGTAGHAAILQPDKYWDQVAVAPNSVLGKGGTRNTKKYKAWSFIQKQKGKTIITQEQSQAVKGMVEAVYQNPAHETAASIFTNREGIIEQSIFFKDASHGFLCKIRADIRFPHIRTLVDLKTSRNASPDVFARDCANFGYDVQAAWYLAGASRATGEDYQNFIFVVIEKVPPHCVAVYRADYAMLDAGRKKIRPLIKTYNDCLKSNKWASYPDEVVDISLPRWALY